MEGRVRSLPRGRPHRKIAGEMMSLRRRVGCEGLCHSIELFNRPAAARYARHALRDQLKALGLATEAGTAGYDAAASAELIVTELVTNACRHTDGPVAMRVGWDGKQIIIEVDDPSPVVPKTVAAPDRGVSGGYGLGLVECLTESWGVRVHATGKTVYASLAFAF